jgi:hypothetical protein
VSRRPPTRSSVRPRRSVSIALGASLISVVDYRVLVAVMAIVLIGCAAYLLTRGPEPIAAEEPAPA